MKTKSAQGASLPRRSRIKREAILLLQPPPPGLPGDASLGAGPGGQACGGELPRSRRRRPGEKGTAALYRASVALQGGCTPGSGRMCWAWPHPKPAPAPASGQVPEAQAQRGPAAPVLWSYSRRCPEGASVRCTPGGAPLAVSGFLSALFSLSAAIPKLLKGGMSS